MRITFLSTGLRFLRLLAPLLDMCFMSSLGIVLEALSLLVIPQIRNRPISKSPPIFLLFFFLDLVTKSSLSCLGTELLFIALVGPRSTPFSGVSGFCGSSSYWNEPRTCHYATAISSTGSRCFDREASLELFLRGSYGADSVSEREPGPKRPRTDQAPTYFIFYQILPAALLGPNETCLGEKTRGRICSKNIISAFSI